MKQYLIFLISLFMVMLGSCESTEERPESANLTFEVQDASVFNGADGAIQVTIEGGEEPFHYFWNTGATTKDISGLPAGSYTLRIAYGKNGLSYMEGTAQVGQPGAEPLTVEYSVTDAAKYGKPLGAITVSVQGGTPPYSIIWSNGADTETITDLYSGYYTVQVEDSSEPGKLYGQATIFVDEPAFVCGQDSIRDVNGNLYATVELGGMCWTVDNLRTTSLPSDPTLAIEERFCRLDYCSNARGAHYSWNAMMNGSAAAQSDYEQIQGIAPQGWHIPTKKEWQDLQAWLAIDGNGGAGTNVWTKVIGAASSSGFNVLATGNWGYGIYTDPNLAAFWTSTQNPSNAGEAEIVYLLENPIIPLRRWFYTQRPKTYGLSVRLVKDQADN